MQIFLQRFFFFENDVFNFSIIDTNKIIFFLKIDVVIIFKINTIKIKFFLNTLFLYFFQKLIKFFIFKNKTIRVLNRFNCMCKNYEFFEIDKVKNSFNIAKKQ